jgi:hypothetical protein
VAGSNDVGAVLGFENVATNKASDRKLFLRVLLLWLVRIPFQPLSGLRNRHLVRIACLHY